MHFRRISAMPDTRPNRQGSASICRHQAKIQQEKSKKPATSAGFFIWRPQGDSNPCTHRERVVS